MEEPLLVPFGKYRGQSIEAMAQDRQYIDWIQQQGWLAEKYPQINTLIINNFAAPSETPDHNKMQGMFLDDEFSKKLVKCHYKKVPHGIDEDVLNEVIQVNKCNFEVDGIDVTFCALCELTTKRLKPKEKNINPSIPFNELKLRPSFSINDLRPETHEEGAPEYISVKINNNRYFRIEIKPSLGDDYPAVLRQIRSLKGFGSTYNNNILLVDNYCGKGLTEQQVCQLFKSQGIIIIFLSEVLGTALPGTTQI